LNVVFIAFFTHFVEPLFLGSSISEPVSFFRNLAKP